MISYSKLHASLVGSSLWCERDDVRLLFITMLALADRDGCVFGSRAGIMRLANLAYNPDVPDPFEILMAPDSDSSDLLRNPEHQGRRLEEIPGGFRLLNHAYYRNLGNEDNRREQNREAQARFRRRKQVVSTSKQTSANVSNGQHGSAESAQAEAKAKAENQRENTRARENTNLDIDQIKVRLSLLSKESFKRTFEAHHWSTDTEQLVRVAMPLTTADLELLAWFYHIPDEHPIFGVTLRRQSFDSVLMNLVSEVQKVRQARKKLGLSEALEEEQEKNLGPAGWEAVARELYPRMDFPESFWDITSPEVQKKIRGRIVG